MTPSEKAKNLVEAYKKYMYPFHPTVAEKQAKECAIISVKEIFELIKGQDFLALERFWNEVKSELEKP